MSAGAFGKQESLARFYLLHAGVPALLAIVLLAVFESSLLDVRIENLFFDPATRTFPLRDDWFFETVIHDAGRLPVILIGVALAAGFALSFRRAGLRPWRRSLFFGALCVAAAPLAVAGLKAGSVIHCPRTLELYGGRQPYIRLLGAIPNGTKRGHCWPGGHSSGGFALMALYFVFRRRKPLAARVCLVGALAYGLALGMGRVVQGAHFVSHILWAALVCWAVILALYELLLRKQDCGINSPVNSSPGRDSLC
jgi:membrane-associated PAP2 superfamily phosphatase